MFKKIFIIVAGSFFLIGLSVAAPLTPQQINQNFARYTEPVSASESTFRDSLVGIINQLQAMKPLIVQAENAQPPHARVQLHFTPWQSADGQWHSGLQTDLNQIQAALIAALNTTQVEPRTVLPLKADFIDSSLTHSGP